MEIIGKWYWQLAYALAKCVFKVGSVLAAGSFGKLVSQRFVSKLSLKPGLCLAAVSKKPASSTSTHTCSQEDVWKVNKLSRWYHLGGCPNSASSRKALRAFAGYNPRHHRPSIKDQSNSRHSLSGKCLLHVHYVPGPKTTL